jgi:hypothetical protein
MASATWYHITHACFRREYCHTEDVSIVVAQYTSWHEAPSPLLALGGQAPDYTEITVSFTAK